MKYQELTVKITSKGFSLIELTIVMLIIGILASLAYSSYSNQITRSERTEGKIALLGLAAHMERYYAQNNTYVGATKADTAKTAHGHYQLQIAKTSATTFTLKAIPQARQAANDIQCGTLSLDQAGLRGQSGSGSLSDCWA